MPHAQIQIDTALVGALLAQQHPNLSHLPLRDSEAGFDNATFRLGESFAVRLPRSAAAARRLENEQRWLIPLSDRLPLSIPVPLRLGLPALGFPWPWSVVPWLLGETAEVAPIAAAEAPRLVEFLRALHVRAPSEAPQNPERAVSLASRATALGERMQRVARSTELITWRVRKAWDEGLNSTMDTQPTWTHGDLHARNVLTLEGTITGIIDWGNLTSGDPAIDLACLWMLLPDASVREAAMAAYGSRSDALWARARGWAALFGIMWLDDALAAGNMRDAAMGEQVLRRM